MKELKSFEMTHCQAFAHLEELGVALPGLQEALAIKINEINGSDESVLMYNPYRLGSQSGNLGCDSPDASARRQRLGLPSRVANTTQSW